MNKQKETKPEDPAPDFQITLLQNSIFYYLQYVFIRVDKKGYRLVVIHRNRLLYDQTYPTMRGAKIAFTKLYQDKSCGNTKAEWTDLYTPQADWWQEKTETLEKDEAP